MSFSANDAAFQMRKQSRFVEKTNLKKTSHEGRTKRRKKLKGKMKQLKDGLVGIVGLGELVDQLDQIIGRGQGPELAAQAFEGFQDGGLGNQMNLGTDLFIVNDLKEGERFKRARPDHAFFSNPLHHALHFSKGTGEGGDEEGGGPKRLGP